MNAHIVISYSRYIDDSLINSFIREIDTRNLTFGKHKQNSSQVYATIEWFIPTAVVVLIARPYLDGFLGEAGKDHYILLKNALRNLSKKIIRKTKNIMWLSANNDTKNMVYNHYISIQAEAFGSYKFIFRMPKDTTDCDEEKIIEEIFIFLQTYYQEGEDSNLHNNIIKNAIGFSIPMYYNIQSGKIEAFDFMKYIREK